MSKEQYDNSRQVIIRKVTASNPKPTTPLMSVEFTGPDGVKYTAPMWEWRRKDGTPVLDKHGNKMYQGNYEEDTWEQEKVDNGMDQAKKASGGFIDDDIPFAQHDRGFLV